MRVPETNTFSYIQVIVGAVVSSIVMVGAVLAYTETKFANKEVTQLALQQEREDRKADVARIEYKLDKILELLIDSKR